MEKLTQREILTALLKGKKIRQSTWKDFQYVHLVDDILVSQSGWKIHEIYVEEDWELYIHTVTFFEALEAMKEGKRIRRVGFEHIIYIDDEDVASTSDYCLYRLVKSDIDAKWQILEGDNE